MKGRGLQAAGGHGGIHVRIILWVAHMENQFARMKLNIFVSGDVTDFELACRHADKQPCGFRNFHDDFKVVLRTIGYAQFG